MVYDSVRTVMLSGRFKGITHRDARARLGRRGISAAWSFQPQVEAVVVGARPGMAAVQARALGLPLLDEAQMMSLTRGASLDRLCREAIVSPVVVDPTDEVLTDLRDIGFDKPSAQAWERLCQRLDRCPDEVMGVALDYAEGLLSRWPWAEGGDPLGQAMGKMPRFWDAVLQVGMVADKFRLAREVSLSCNAGGKKAMAAMAKGDWRCLRSVELLGWSASPGFLDRFCGMGARLPQVERVVLSRMGVSWALLQKIADGVFPNVRWLCLNNTSFVGRQAMRPTDRLLSGQIEGVSVAGGYYWMPNHIAGLLAGIKRLSLKNGAVHGGRAAGMWARELGERLEVLDMSSNILGKRGMRALLQNPKLTGLRNLNVRNCRVGDKGLRPLSFSAVSVGLKHFDLSFNPFDDKGMENLVRSHRLKLESLQISSCGLTPRAGALLAKAENMSGLRSLDLSNNLLGDAFALELAHNGTMPELEYLDMRNTGLTPLGHRALERVEGIKTLRLGSNPALEEAPS